MSSEKRRVENGQSGWTVSACSKSIDMWSDAAVAIAIQENPAQEICFWTGMNRENKNAARATAIKNAIECVAVRCQWRYAEGPKFALKQSRSAMLPATTIASTARQEARGKKPRCSAREASPWVTGSTDFICYRQRILQDREQASGVLAARCGIRDDLQSARAV